MIAQTVGSKRSRVYLPFARLALCVDCEQCFDIDALHCPACGSESVASVARFLGARPHATAPSGPATDKASRSGRPRDAESTRHLVIVARDRPSLYDYLTAAFAGNDAVTVILERRTIERRRAQTPVVVERRRRDRRRDGQVLERLGMMGWAVIEMR